MKNHNKILSGITIMCLLLFSMNTVQAQTTTQETEYNVEGIVSNENLPLPGVSIVLQGTNIGTETDIDGNFQFPNPLKVDAVLVFSHIGMETQKVTIKSSDSGSTLELKIIMYSNSYNLLGKVSTKKAYKSKKK